MRSYVSALHATSEHTGIVPNGIGVKPSVGQVLTRTRVHRVLLGVVFADYIVCSSADGHLQFTGEMLASIAGYTSAIFALIIGIDLACLVLRLINDPTLLASAQAFAVTFGLNRGSFFSLNKPAA